MGRQCTVGAAYKQCRKEEHKATKPLQKSLSHTSPFSSASSSSPFSCSPSLSSPPLLRSGGWCPALSRSLSLPLIQAEPWTQAAAVCESVCESVCARSGERRSAGSLTETLPLPQTHNPTHWFSPPGSENASLRSTLLPPRPVKRPPHGAM